MNLFNIRRSLINTIDYQLSELERYLKDHPEFEEFVGLVLTPSKYTETGTKTVSDSLHDLLYDITKYDYSTALSNEYHRDANVITNLNSFIGNFLLDDAAFFVYKGKYTWGAKQSDNSGPWFQDVNLLIEASKDNTEFCNYVGTSAGFELLKKCKMGMKTSGNVEKLLTRGHYE
jgi:hypothetical protein